MSYEGDLKYKELFNKIKVKGVEDVGKVRAVFSDGTPALTKSVFGVQVDFDEGVIPLISSKKVFTKTAIKEMLLFWVKQSVLQRDFIADNVKVWDEWFKDGSLGKSYAYQFESRPICEVIEVSRRVFKREDYVGFFQVDYPIPNTVPSKHDGLYTHDKYGEYEVLGRTLGSDYKIVVRFLNTGYVLEVPRSDFCKKLFRDVFTKCYYNGFGCLGDISKVRNLNDFEIKHLKQVWTNMLKRCYNPTDKDYQMYGGSGCVVSNRWQCFQYFLEDVKEVPQFFLAKAEGFVGWNIDKDYYGANGYSKETSTFLTRCDNNLYSHEKPFVVSGDILNGVYISQRYVASLLGVDSSGISAALRGIQGSCGKHKFSYHKSDKLYRYKLSENQVVKLIEEIKLNKNSKRLLTSFWNFRDVSSKVLQECAFQTQWKVVGDRLDLILTQRSCDFGLGLPFNWFQYKSLQTAIAHCTDYKVGRFIHQIGDLHYYSRHEDVLLNQFDDFEINNSDSQKLSIKSDHKNFFELTVDDFELVGYNPTTNKVSMPVAV